MGKPKVVIIGGGFGGLTAAKTLRKAPVEVTLVDRTNHHLFQPLLYQVATATLSPADIAWPIRHVVRKAKNTEVLLAEVTDVDWEGKRVLTKDTDPLPYDYLIVATGATHSYFGHPEFEKYAPGLKSIEDATSIRGKVLAAFEYAERADNEAERKQWLTFLIVGAGPTGVEMAGAIAEISQHVLLKDFKRIDPADARVIVIEGGKRVLSSYDEGLSENAAKTLRHMKVDLRLNTMVEGIDANGVTTKEGRIDGKTIIWAAGVQASPAAQWLKVDQDRSGRVQVNPDLTVNGREGVYVIGDCAHLEQDGHELPGVAQVAIQEGKFVAKQVIALVTSHPSHLTQFRYKDLGSLATIGRKSAVAQFGKVHLSGLIAWVIWLFVHIMNLVGFRSKISVLLQWAWAYFTWDRGARLITKPD